MEIIVTALAACSVASAGTAAAFVVARRHAARTPRYRRHT
jgi:hypothetical protein